MPWDKFPQAHRTQPQSEPIQPPTQQAAAQPKSNQERYQKPHQHWKRRPPLRVQRRHEVQEAEGEGEAEEGGGDEEAGLDSELEMETVLGFEGS